MRTLHIYSLCLNIPVKYTLECSEHYQWFAVYEEELCNIMYPCKSALDCAIFERCVPAINILLDLGTDTHDILYKRLRVSPMILRILLSAGANTDRFFESETTIQWMCNNYDKALLRDIYAAVSTKKPYYYGLLLFYKPDLPYD